MGHINLFADKKKTVIHIVKIVFYLILHQRKQTFLVPFWWTTQDEERSNWPRGSEPEAGALFREDDTDREGELLVDKGSSVLEPKIFLQ